MTEPGVTLLHRDGRWGISQTGVPDDVAPHWTLLELSSGLVVRLVAMFPQESDAIDLMGMLAARDQFVRQEVLSTGYLSTPRFGAMDA